MDFVAFEQPTKIYSQKLTKHVAMHGRRPPMKFYPEKGNLASHKTFSPGKF